MATEARKASTFAACTALAGADSVVTLTTSTVANNALTTVAQLFSNVQVNVSISNAASLIVVGSNTPANSTALANVVKGTIWYDNQYLYVATANAHVRRASVHNFPGDLSLPNSNGTSGQVLTSNGDGTSQWEDGGGGLPSMSPSSNGEFLTNDGSVASWSGVTVTTHIPLTFQISEADLTGNITQQLVSPLTGRVSWLYVIVQDNITTGGIIQVKLNGSTIVGSGFPPGTVEVTVANSDTPGTMYNKGADSSDISAVCSEGDIITLELVGFATAGRVNGIVLFQGIASSQ